MPRRIEPMFVWLPYDRTVKQSILINSTDVTEYVNFGTDSFTFGLLGEELGFEFELDNSGEQYTNVFNQGDIVTYKMNITDGTTVQFKGEIEKLESKQTDSGFTITVSGGHLSNEFLDVLVTESFSGATITDIWKNLVDTYLTGFTYANVETISDTASPQWDGIPLMDCFLDLCKLGDCDAYLDNDKDFHLFKKNSKNNDNEAITWKDALITLHGLGTDSVDVKNSISVVGESSGLPVLYTSVDSGSVYRTKEARISNKDITDEDTAQEYADAELNDQKNPPTTGSAECYIMYQLVPGYLMYVIHNPHKIHARYRPVKFTIRATKQTCEVFFSQDRGLAKLFKERIQKDMKQEDIKNPYRMTHSYNFVFNDYSKTDTISCNNITITEGKLKIPSGLTGTWISNVKSYLNNATKCQVMVKGESITGNVIPYVNFDGTDNWQELSLDRTIGGMPSTGEITIASSGSEVKLKLVINSTSTQIEAAAILFK